MAPRPLSEVNPNAAWAFNHYSLAERPELSHFVAEVIATWAYVDSTITQFLSRNLLRADFQIVTEMLLELNSFGRRRAVQAAAKAKLKAAEHLDLFDAVFATTEPSRKRRNEFAHFLWGITSAIPDCLLLLDPKEYYRSDASFREAFSEEWPSHAPAPFPDNSEIMVFDRADLEAETRLATKAQGYFGELLFALSPTHVGAADARAQLLRHPDINAFVLKRQRSRPGD